MKLGRLTIEHPIIQAPMAGGGDTPALVAEVGEAGAIGFLGAAYLAPEAILETARAVRERTKRPFGINLFSPLPAPGSISDFGPALARVAGFYEELGLPPPVVPKLPAFSFEDQIAAVVETDAAAFSFTFGIPPPSAIDAVKARGMLVIGTATTVEEAALLEKAGVDAIAAQGSEAGAHRGTFAGSFESSLIGTMALVPQVVDRVSVPVLASGGIMDGRGIAAALALGATAVQMGTAFLTCDEAGIPEVYKQAILAAREDGTRVTRAFSGRHARGIVNRFMNEVEGDSVLPFPLQNTLTRPLRTAAAKAGRAELLSLWAGQGAPLARRQSARLLVERLAVETAEVLRRLGAPSD